MSKRDEKIIITGSEAQDAAFERVLAMRSERVRQLRAFLRNLALMEGLVSARARVTWNGGDVASLQILRFGPR